MNLYNTTKRITDTAVMIGIMVVFAFIGFYLLPVLSIFYPVPAIVLASRHNIKYSIIAIIVSSIIVALFTNILVGISILLLYGLPGISLAYMINKKYKPYEIFITGTAAFLVFTILSIKMFEVITGIGFIDELKGIFNQSFNLQLKILKDLNLSSHELNTIEKLFKNTIDFVLSIIPAILIISSMFLCYVNYWISTVVIRRIGGKVVPITKFKDFRLPNNVIIGISIILLATFMLKYINVFYYETILTNIVVLVFTVFFIQGFAVILFFTDRAKIHKAFKVLLFILMIIYLPIIFIIAFIGLIDSLFNLRRIGNQ